MASVQDAVAFRISGKEAFRKQVNVYICPC